jgi:hypothetical protein
MGQAVARRGQSSLKDFPLVAVHLSWQLVCADDAKGSQQTSNCLPFDFSSNPFQTPLG